VSLAVQLTNSFFWRPLRSLRFKILALLTQKQNL
jgi:hypothetical protein